VGPQAAVTPLDRLPFFIAFLKMEDRFKPWVEEYPLPGNSPNAPQKRDVLGKVLLSILAGIQKFQLSILG
jgi:hypothetical protein